MIHMNELLHSPNNVIVVSARTVSPKVTSPLAYVWDSLLERSSPHDFAHISIKHEDDTTLK